MRGYFNEMSVVLGPCLLL